MENQDERVAGGHGMAVTDPMLLWAPQAWVHGGWRQQVLLRMGMDGRWSDVRTDAAPPPQATRLAGPVLPGLVNAHSHAFQRAFAGLAERRSGAQEDDFWSWRDRMYAIALRISPEVLKAVAAQLYTELLMGGYTQVCEFHYLHHAPDGSRYADPMTNCRALIQAAQETGIGLTLMPVVYERAGFGQTTLRDEQRRFAARVDDVLALRDGIRSLRQPRISAALALHSLRAVTPEAIQRLLEALQGDVAPIHIHVAEQTGEVDECVATTGLRPLEWLVRHVPLDQRWQLVHATHAAAWEIEAVAQTGAGVVLCPSTEADLGDGLPDLPRWLDLRVPLSVGSDSQVTRHWGRELQWLEYGQRLVRRRRNVAAAPDLGLQACAARLFNRVVTGGAVAAGLGAWGLAPGSRADMVMLDPQAPGLLGVPPSHVLDALVFATDAPPIAAVWVAGRQVVCEGRHLAQGPIAAAFARAMAGLWGTE
jgi:formimidoylglutamate deiminase